MSDLYTRSYRIGRRDTEARLAARIETLEAALRYYATQYCEGWCKDAPAHADFDDCGGCRARAALAPEQDK